MRYYNTIPEEQESIINLDYFRKKFIYLFK